MKKILLIIFVLMTCCGCTATETTSRHPEREIVINLPTDNSVNGYRNSSDDSEDSFAYYANTKTKKFHTPDCRYSQKIDKENLYASNSREDMFSKGYKPCKICKP